MATKKAVAKGAVVIEAPRLETLKLLIRGTAPYVQCKFSKKAQEIIHAAQAAGSTAKKNKKRLPKDFMDHYKGAMHTAVQGWYGIPAPAFRNAMISACRIVGFTMTRAKLGVFVEPDGFDAEGTALVKITKGKPTYFETYVRLATGVPDLRARPMWHPGWEAVVTITYDAEMFTQADICNLMMRVGKQVGIGEGRPDSKSSCGQGWGLFDAGLKGSA